MKHLPLEAIAVVWDRNLKPGQCFPHPTLPATFVVGVGTPLHEVVFRANLTIPDRQFLRSIKIGVE